MSDGQDAVRMRADARIGQVLRAKWRLDRLLGVGGMAAVYEATHRNGKRGAVKMLHLELSIDSEAKSRFLREGYVANKVDHPGAVSVLDDDVADDGSVFLVMELLEGQSVDARSKTQPGFRLPVPDVVTIAVELLDVLVAAHEKGIVHRDLKPENLFVSRHGQVKVLDFGIARLREMSSGGQATRTGSVMGTPAFMPPEQALGNWNQIDGRTDLWATGATMFRLLSGRDVHLGENVNKLLLAAMTQHPVPLASVAPGVPPQLAQIVDRALLFDQNQRWPDARAMQAALRSFAASAGIPLAQAPPLPSSLGSATGGFGAPSSAVLAAPPASAPAPATAAPVTPTHVMSVPQGPAPGAAAWQAQAPPQGHAASAPPQGYAPQAQAPQSQPVYPSPQAQPAYPSQPPAMHASQRPAAPGTLPSAGAPMPHAAPPVAAPPAAIQAAAMPPAPLSAAAPPSHATSPPVTSDRHPSPGKSSKLGLTIGAVAAAAVLGAVIAVLAMRGSSEATGPAQSDATAAASAAASAGTAGTAAPEASASATAASAVTATASATATATATAATTAAASAPASGRPSAGASAKPTGSKPKKDVFDKF